MRHGGTPRSMDKPVVTSSQARSPAVVAPHTCATITGTGDDGSTYVIWGGRAPPKISPTNRAGRA